ncbi:MAG: ribonuclease Y [Phototrophicales bacterium]|nr:MAG: ribonuclease Y [Phototrophicales bacterium]RMG70953.1 MAG: ribonuclease Y [Chloroflexota bacterium]
MGPESILLALAGLVVGAALGIWGLTNYQTRQGKNRIQLAEQEAQKIIEQAKQEAQHTLRDAEQKIKALQRETDETIARRRRDLDREEERLQRRRDDLDSRFERLEKREQNLNKRQSNLDKRENDLKRMETTRMEELERIAQMTQDEARAELLQSAEKEARNDIARIIRQVEAEAREEADARARDIIALAVQRLASEHVSEIAVSVVPLPNDEMKGRIIGRNGRNIRAFELATGVDVVVDDTPEAVTISSFDPVRREVAKRAMEKLVTDGRIHPARIEKLVEDARAEVENNIREEGERAAYETGVHGLHPEIIRLLGMLRFRTSYGQNQHAHSIETAHLAGMIAAELGADVEVAKAGGLLHDIGKAIDHEVEGTHAIIGAEFLKRHGIKNRKILNAVAAHHHEVEHESVEAYIVEAADAISGARPGARRESLESYIKRVKTLEEIATSFEGVEQSYALQAGREVRIIVRPDVVDDLSALRLARDIARQIEETMQYPGQIKVHVIRETRAVDYAK